MKVITIWLLLSLTTLGANSFEEEAFDLEKELAALEAELREAELAQEGKMEAEDLKLTPESLEDPLSALPSIHALPEMQQEVVLSEQPEAALEKKVVELQSLPANSTPLLFSKEQVALKIPQETNLSPPPEPRIEKEEVTFAEDSFPLLTEMQEEIFSPQTLNINFRQVFSGAPLIYSLLFFLSIGTLFLWLYSLLRMRQVASLSPALLKHLKMKLGSNQYEEALSLCQENNNFFCRMIAAGINARNYGRQVLIDSMKEEGKQASVSLWQKLALLNDVAIIAPMLGLLGTVLGMFYAFYDLNRSLESFTTLFDGLGISVGTTVAGIIVAILAMSLRSIARYRLVRVLSRVESEAQTLANLIHNKPYSQG